MFICGVVLWDAFVFKGFWNFNNQFECDFSRWYSRLTRVLFNGNARVRPSIIEYMIWCCGAQETSWMTIRTPVLVYIYSVVLFSCILSCMRAGYDYCQLCVMWLMYSDDVMYKHIYLFLCKDHLLSIIFYSAAMVRFWCCFSTFFFYLFFFNPNGSYFCSTWVDWCRIVLTQGVRICGSLHI